MRWGIFLAVLGIACYIVHAILLNDVLRKNAPDVLARDPVCLRNDHAVCFLSGEQRRDG